MIISTGLFIDNQSVRAEGTDEIEVRSPANHGLVGRAGLAGPADVARAVESARRAFDHGAWPKMEPEARRAVLIKAGQLLAPHEDGLSRLVTQQNGTVISSRQGDASRLFDFYSTVSFPADDARSLATTDGLVVREPMGVVAAIVPWNSPMNLALGKVLPALLAGCTVVLKPSPETPLQDFTVAEAFAEAGLPPGALNIVPAGREASESLVRHPGVDMVSFTGSTIAGRRIGAICGERIRPVLLELGGKSAAVVLDDVDVEKQAAAILRTGVLVNNGESCMAWSRVLVPRSRHEELVDALATVMRETVVGDPLDPATEVGPLVAQRQLERVEGYIRSGVEEGARVVVGGGRPAGLDAGWYIEPTLFVSAHNSMRMCREEIFGPVATVIAYDDEDEAVAIANDSDFGLAGAVFTADPEHGIEVARRIRTGTVGVNSTGVANGLPFGGYKDSGIGRAHGPEGFAEYMQVKTIGLPPGALALARA